MDRELPASTVGGDGSSFGCGLTRVLILAVLAAGLAILLCTFVASQVTINLTASLPRGLYWLRPDTQPTRGSIVVLPIPEPVQELVSTRHYLPTTFHLLKRVVAIEGDRVCTAGNRYVINGQLLSWIATQDRAGRPLPGPYAYCGLVLPGTVFVAGEGPSSLDSRYFGPVTIQTLTTAVPLWTSS